MVQDFFATNALVHQLRRNLSLAETGDVDLRGDVAIRVIDARLEFFGGDRDVELDACRAQLLNGCLHVVDLL